MGQLRWLDRRVYSYTTAIAVPVIHVDVCGMTGVDGGNAMPARLRAGDAAVAVVVIDLEGTATSVTRRDWDRRRDWSRTIAVDVQRRRCTPRQDAFQHVSFKRVDGEGITLAHLDDTTMCSMSVSEVLANQVPV